MRFFRARPAAPRRRAPPSKDLEGCSGAQAMSNYTRWCGFRVNEAQVKREIRRTARQGGRSRLLRGLLILCCVAACFGMQLKWAVLGVVVLRGDGMTPVLRGGEVVLYAHSLPVPGAAILKPRVGELVLVSGSDGHSHRRVVRRVVALAGDEVSVDARGRVTVNGEELDEPYAAYRTEIEAKAKRTGESLIPNPFALDREEEEEEEEEPEEERQETETREQIEFPVRVPEGKVFVLADDRDALDDSRSKAFGMINEADVLGMPCVVLWPVDRIRLLKDFRAQEHLPELNPVAGSMPAPTESPEDEGQGTVLQ